MSGALAWVRRRFPDVSWDAAERSHGAFHDVVLTADVVARVVAENAFIPAESEHGVWRSWQRVELPVAVPALISDVRSGDGRSGYLTSRLPGRPATDVPWESVRGVVAGLLAALREVDVSGLPLPPVRTWCGGDRFPRIVGDELAPLLIGGSDRRTGALAVDVVERMLDLAPIGPPVLVHGDLGPHNLLWDLSSGGSGRAAGLIDVDHACLADQVVDLAPLVGFYGATALREIAPAADVERAVVYRATLPLQVAAAAHLGDNTALREHALGNFARRARAAGPPGMLLD